MSHLRTRSIQELVQKMMEINTRLEPESNPSVPGQDKPETGGPVESGDGVQTAAKQPVPIKIDGLPKDISEKAQSLLEFNQANLIRGIVFGEILGKPRSRRGR